MAHHIQLLQEEEEEEEDNCLPRSVIKPQSSPTSPKTKTMSLLLLNKFLAFSSVGF
jgi:hypothetical protein